MNGDLITRSGLRWSFQWREFVINHNDVKPCSEVIKIETEFLTSECVEKRYPIFFKSTTLDNVKVPKESRANTILRHASLFSKICCTPDLHVGYILLTFSWRLIFVSVTIRKHSKL